MRMKIYLSGKITGQTEEQLRLTFGRKEQELQELGYQVVNPLKNGVPTEASWIHHMIVDIWMMLRCDAVYMLSNWTQSRGAKIESRIARFLGMFIIYE